MNLETTITHSHEDLMAGAIRALSMDAVQKANSGHPGMPMGMADAATVLFNRFVRVDPSAPDWPDRDRFILSAGHGSMLLYAIHHLLGYEDMGMSQLRAFRQLGSRTAGHPEYGHALGIETTTGPLGQGLANAVGMALAERMHNARFGDALVDHYTYAIVGDGCLMEGISHEATDLAGHLGLGRLIVLWDDNQITIDGSTELSTSINQQARFSASGWHVNAVDGHDNEAVAQAIEAARLDPRPSLIACRTIIGYGAPNKAGTAGVHGAPLGEEEIAAARKTLGWTHAPFDIPTRARESWNAVAIRGKLAHTAWETRLQRSEKQPMFRASLAQPESGTLKAAMAEYKRKLCTEAPKLATRKASEMALEVVNTALPNTIGGSADLTGSNNTRTRAMKPITREDYSGDYIHYGIREHGMAAAMNGISLHGGFIPYGGTFLVFADYCRPAIRLSALMRQPVTYVMTHDSIGLGEDGPTHQPVEHIASLRAMPNVNVIRPADAVETAEAWEIAAMASETPTLLCLSRQGVPAFRTEYAEENKLACGAYLLGDVDRERDVTLLASGSEVSIALEAAASLKAGGIKAAIVSVPCFELFAAQNLAYRRAVLGTAPRVAVEAGVQQGWEALLGEDGIFVGMSSFGASAPAAALYQHFAITSAAVVAATKQLVAQN